MKIQLIYSLIILFFLSLSCNQQKNNHPENWDAQKLSDWYLKGEWEEGWNVQPDESINQREFAVQYFKNPSRWKKAFSFLKNNDLASLKPGRHEIEGADLFVNVDEYVTRNEEDTRFEAHRKYADIQYLVSGEEYIGVVSLDKTTEKITYDQGKDIVFLSSEENNYRLADPQNYFIFFPEDAHRPCTKTGKNTKVRKVVVKVRIN